MLKDYAQVVILKNGRRKEVNNGEWRSGSLVSLIKNG